MPLSTTYANQYLNFLLAKTATLSAPATVYIGLCTNDPVADDGTFEELAGNGYARVLVSQKGETYPNLFGSAADRKITNQQQINWTKATMDWPSEDPEAKIQGFGLFSSLTGGTPFYYGKLKEPIRCVAGAVALFDPQGLEISFSIQDEEAAATTAE